MHKLPRIPRKNVVIDNDKRRAIIEKAELGEDFISLAHDLGVKRSTAYMIVRSGRVEKKKRGGIRQARVERTEQLEEELVRLVESDPLHTLKQLKEKTNHVVSVRTGR